MPDVERRRQDPMMEKRIWAGQEPDKFPSKSEPVTTTVPKTDGFFSGVEDHPEDVPTHKDVLTEDVAEAADVIVPQLDISQENPARDGTDADDGGEEEEPIATDEFDEGESEGDDEQDKAGEDMTRLSFGATGDHSSAQVFIENSDRGIMEPITIAPQDLEEVGEEGGAVEDLINVALPEIISEPSDEIIPMEEEGAHTATSENPETIARSSFLPGRNGTRTQELLDGLTDKPPKTDDEAEEPLETLEEPEPRPPLASHSGTPRGARMAAQRRPPAPPSIAM